MNAERDANTQSASYLSTSALYSSLTGQSSERIIQPAAIRQGIWDRQCPPVCHDYYMLYEITLLKVNQKMRDWTQNPQVMGSFHGTCKVRMRS